LSRVLDKIPSKTKSFRLDTDILSALDTESARRGTSVNNLTNQILRKWVNFDRFVQDFGYVTFSVHDFLRGMNSLDDRMLHDLASEAGKRFPKDLILFTGQKNDLSNCIHFVESILCDYMKWGNYHSSSTETEYVITIRHNYGPKWSHVLQSMLQSMFETNAKTVPTFTLTDGTVLMNVEKPPKIETEEATVPKQEIDESGI
jgi:hypothetical protein